MKKRLAGSKGDQWHIEEAARSAVPCSNVNFYLTVNLARRRKRR